MNFKRFTYSCLLLLGFTMFFNCAKRGMPQGGIIDTIPPAFVKATPENFTTNFNAEEIRIDFNEYIKLDNPQRQIIVSPPMDPKPEIYPMGSASKFVRIKILDTLLENTTYTINFGNSITDNNEANPLPFFKYIFSTGSYVDSLSVSGKIKDAFNNETEELISVMLYEVDSTYTDSVVFDELPTYISYPQDTLNRFTVENMKEGSYRMVAMVDKNQNYKFDPKSDKIGFVDSLISLPTEETFNLSIFKEILDFEVERPKQLSKNHLIFGYKGNADSTKIEVLSETSPDFEYRILKDAEKDTLHYWYKPFQEVDSLIFKVSNQKYKDTVLTKIKDMESDSLEVKAINQGTLNVNESLNITSNTPLSRLDTTLVKIIDQDSLTISYTSTYKERENTFQLNFEKTEKQSFNIQLLPGALQDFYESTNDTLNYRVKTPAFSELGVLSMTVSNLKSFPVIVQLTNAKGNVYKELIHTEKDGNVFLFNYVKPASYLLRIIYDENNNGKWDTGNFLRKTQPEEVIYYPKEIEVRANWDVVEQFTLD
jgi:uncharacterized protein (DUF2141 family)